MNTCDLVFELNVMIAIHREQQDPQIVGPYCRIISTTPFIVVLHDYVCNTYDDGVHTNRTWVMYSC